MADERDEIRARVNIVDLVGREIPLKQRGKNWTGLCPFHPDKNPSFTVTAETGRFRCWSCGETGDIFDWVMKRRNVDFAEALSELAKEAGIELRRGGGLPANTRHTLESAMDQALAFFREEFSRSTAAKDYCVRRGLEDAVLNEWELGYGPDVGDALPVYLKKHGVSLSEAKNLYLVDEDSRGGFFARFRGRLMFPIRDEKGVLVAFGGRLLGDGQPKYINSSDTPLYRKSRVLYGMYKAREHMRSSRRAVLVEGYLDVIACHRAGVNNAVASLGTSMTDDQAKLLKRWCDEVVILYDSDDAGQKAAARAVEILDAEGLRVRVALMPPGDDPDTLLKKDGPAAIQRVVEAGVSPSTYRLQLLERRVSPSEDAFWPEAAAILADESNDIEMVRHLDRLAGVFPGTRDLNLAKRSISGMIARARRARKKGEDSSSRPATVIEPKAFKGEMTSAEVVIFCAFMSEEFRKQGHAYASMTNLFESRLGQRISAAVKTLFATAPVGKPVLWLAQFGDPEIEAVLADVANDARGANLTSEYLAGTIGKLREKFTRRKLLESRRENADPSVADTILRELKPDPRRLSNDPDDLF